MIILSMDAVVSSSAAGISLFLHSLYNDDENHLSGRDDSRDGNERKDGGSADELGSMDNTVVVVTVLLLSLSISADDDLEDKDEI